MAKDKKIKGCVCPGCSRHCPMGTARCKYGRNYFAKCRPCPKAQEQSSEASPRKWKKSIEKGGLTHLFMKTAKEIKKGLKRGVLSEEALLSRLNPTEKESLEAILNKLQA